MKGIVSLGFRLAVAGVALAGTAGPGMTAPNSDAAAKPGQERPAASIDGFRSARFGMSEDEVRKAIRKDFGLKDAEILRQENMVERTGLILARVNDLLPDSGPATVSYIFGYKSKKLIHVNVVWDSFPAGDEGRRRAGTVAALLRTHFLGLAHQGEVVDAQLPDGSVLVYRGADAKGRMVALVVSEAERADPQGAQAAAKAGDKAPAPARVPLLRLSYIENPVKPDIFRIEPGQF